MKSTILIFSLVLGAILLHAEDASGPARPVPHVPPPDVKRGDKVAVTVTCGGVMVTFEAESESTSHIGETVIVLNPESGKRFVARVEDKGKVVVKK